MSKPRGVLLIERREVSDIPDGIGIKITGYREVYEIAYAWINPPARLAGPDTGYQDPVSGVIEIGEPFGNLPCSGALVVMGSEVHPRGKGYGGILYDVALEVASRVGNGLMPDRSSVSHYANRVWAGYLTKRGDVSKKQLDNPDGDLTPRYKEDDCFQTSAVKGARTRPGEWFDQPESKFYRKPNIVVMRALKKAGKLFIGQSASRVKFS